MSVCSMGKEWDSQQIVTSLDTSSVEPFPTSSGQSGLNQGDKQVAASQSNYQSQWYEYYAAQGQQPVQQLGDKAARASQPMGVSAAPPLPSVPPPQAPPPPVTTSSAWNTSVSSYDATAYGTYTVQQTQPQQIQATYSQDGQQSNPSLPSQPGANNYVYSSTYPNNDQHTYGSSNYQSYGYGYPQQGNDSYSQNMGPYASSAAPYQPTSYQNTSTYYSNGVYQPTGAYQSTGYNGSWSDSNYANYGNYPGYSGYPTSDAGGNYAGQYQQPGNYYPTIQSSLQAATETVGPPGIETVASANVTQAPVSTYASVVAHGTAYSAASQPPPPGTQPPWQVNVPQASSTAASNGHAHWSASSSVDQYGKVHTGAFHQQVQPQVPVQPLQQQSMPQYQPSTYQQPAQKLFNHKSPVKIPSNPRIPQNLHIEPGLLPPQRPAYVSVAGKLSSISGKTSSNDVADATIKPGMFPPSLRAYVERALSRCKDDTQKAVCQQIMKEIITKASSDGTLFSTDWDTEPLFPLPNLPDGKGDQLLASTMNLDRQKKSKSRWEPVVENVDTKLSNLQNDLSKSSALNQPKQAGAVVSMNWVKRDGPWTKPKGFQPLQQKMQQQQQQQQEQQQQQQQQKQQLEQMNLVNASRKTGKRQRKSNLNGDSDGSSQSDNEADVGGVFLGNMGTANNPEEHRKRQTRTKRFENCKDSATFVKSFVKQKMGGAVSANARRASALRLALSYGDGNGQAVEDIDWDSLTIKGTCQEIEKRYLRLTSAPDPATVRPEEVLTKALEMVKSTTKNYFYKCEQLKSIRQDLTVQRIRNDLTVQVYETHARAALEAGDLAEYNQCQAQLNGLYAEGIKGCCNEFAAYSLLYIIFQNGSNRDLLSSLARLSREAKQDDAVKHALAVRATVALGNYISFFRLYRTAPNLNFYFMDLYVEKMRFEALRCMSRSYRPTLPLEVIARTLGFASESSEKEALDECEEWVKAHGGHIITDSSTAERQFDAKTSSTTLFMPEPEDAVSHGDANLAVNDFLTRSVPG